MRKSRKFRRKCGKSGKFQAQRHFEILQSSATLCAYYVLVVERLVQADGFGGGGVVG